MKTLFLRDMSVIYIESFVQSLHAWDQHMDQTYQTVDQSKTGSWVQLLLYDMELEWQLMASEMFRTMKTITTTRMSYTLITSKAIPHI